MTMPRKNLKIMFALIKVLGFNLSLVMFLAVLNGTVGFLFSIAITVLGALTVAKLLGEVILLSYTHLLVLIAVTGSFRGLLRYVEQYSNHHIAFKILAILRDKIYVTLTTLYPAKLEGKKKGSVISMISSDIETLEVFYAHTISPVFIAVISSTVTSLFIALVINPYLALFALCSYIIVGYVIPKISIKYLNAAGKTYRKNFSEFNGSYMDLIKGSNNIIMASKQEQKISEVNALTQNLLAPHNTIKNKSAKLEASVNSIIVILNVLMLSLGLYLFSLGTLSLPLVLVALVTLMSSFGPVLALSNLPSALNQSFASANRVLDLLDEKPLISDIEDGLNFEFENLEIKNLEFSYNDKHQVITNFDLKIKKGEIVGLLGQSGCGKSTLLKLILRFWGKTDGQILFNDKDVEQINTKSLRKNVSLVNQTTYLFNDSIRNNILISNPKASKEQIINACKSASIHDFIMSLEFGYDSIYSPSEGLGFSSGEKQRIGLARAFLSTAPLILLDEPTSNVDAINEGIFLKAIKSSSKDKAIIIVSHKKSVMSITNKTIVMGD